ncbi:beta strand repeat-containing protein [Colwellia sp. 20A7]|uniref:beta strand repeat-containing protein n=1 Tax=Colwellia sp. 20A7 TaxID=2689569 RepID=UPI00135BA6EC|nr:carboxypeptidase-like regulatory domain-containing protein [Colwellia sp. 20A7]
MVNKTQFYKTKVALAVVLSLGLAACGDSDGDANTATSESVVEDNGGNTVEQAQGSGTVQGTVQDTNGLPVLGATVSIAGQSMVTDASGYYHFTNVPVAGVDGSNSANENQGAYLVTITGPDGYASATVSVTSQNIQIDSGNNGSNGENTTNNGEQITWFDGFLAQADTANLPMFSAQVTGVLRNCKTGAALPAGVTVALDFWKITTTGTNAGSNVNVGVPTFTTTTGAGGVFSFDALPTDSDLTLAVEGYTSVANDDTAIEFEQGGVSTTAEGIVNNLGDTNVCIITSNDDVNPYITNVTGYIEETKTSGGQTWGVLNRGVNQTFTIWFNEAVDADRFNTDDVLATLGEDSYLTIDTATLSDDATSLTVVLTEALDEGDKVAFFIPKADATDVAGNFFSITANDNLDPEIEFDDFTTANSGKASYLRVNLCIFIEPTTGGSGTGTQIVDDKSGEDGDSALLAAYSNAFVDSREDNNDSVIQQINGADSAERLSVFRAIQGSVARTSSTDVATLAGTTITLSDTPAAIASYTVNGTVTAVTSVSGNVLTVPGYLAGDVLTVTYIPATYVDTSTRIAIEFDGSATATSGSDSVASTSNNPTLDVDNVSHNSQVTINYTDDLDVTTKTEKVTVTDQAKPTTVIQDDYDLHGYNNTGTYTATVSTSGQAQYGNGGETSNPGVSDIPGNPTIYIQPRHLAQKGTSNVAPARGTEFDELVADMSDRLGSGETPSAAAGNESTLSVFAPNDATLTAALYDAEAIESWTVGQDIGVAFSEEIALATGAPIYTGTAAYINGYTAENSVTSDVDGNANVLLANNNTVAVEADLVIFNATDVVGLANDDHGSILAFTDAVADIRGNVADADTNAQVVLLDAMPPMVTSALWNGTQLIVTFNEAITLSSTASNLTVYSPEDSTAGPGSVGVTTTNGTLTDNGTTLTVDLSSTEAGTISTLFANGNDNEFLYEDNSAATGEENHAVLAWDGISDTNSNKWETFNYTTVTPENRYDVRAPRFLMVNGVGTFTYSVATTGYEDVNNAGALADADGNVTFAITFTHPIDLSSTVDGGTGTALGNAINAAVTGTWSAYGNGSTSQMTFTSASAADLPAMNAIFGLEDIGSADVLTNTGTAGTFATANGASAATGSIVISADFRTITLNISAGNNGVDFGVSDFIFNTVVDSSLIDGAQTSAGRFNWQNTQ